MRQVGVALGWVGLCVWVWWPRFAQAEGAVTLPLSECRLDHPLHLTSVPARCGALRVPEDREHPTAGSIELKVAVVPALNRRSTAPPMFLLAGGPGQSAMQVYVALSSAFTRINRNHAIVLLDQRGTGNSSPQTCEYPEEWQQPVDPMPALRQATRDCLPSWGSKCVSIPPASRFEILTRCVRPWATSRSICTARRMA